MPKRPGVYEPPRAALGQSPAAEETWMFPRPRPGLVVDPRLKYKVPERDVPAVEALLREKGLWLDGLFGPVEDGFVLFDAFGGQRGQVVFGGRLDPALVARQRANEVVWFLDSRRAQSGVSLTTDVLAGKSDFIGKCARCGKDLLRGRDIVQVRGADRFCEEHAHKPLVKRARGRQPGRRS